MSENLKRLEEKIAYLERHVVEQDKAMLEFSRELGALRRAMHILRARLASGTAGEDGEEKAEERPPHF